MKTYSFLTILFLIILAIETPLLAIPETTETISQHAVDEISASGPSEESPFLIEREDAKQAAAKAVENNTSVNTLYPPRHSISKQVAQFCKNLMGSVRASASSKIPSLQLAVVPGTFSVADNPELNVTFKITNNKKELVTLPFSTTQRLELVIKENTGNTIYRWSQDRSFEPSDDVVMINPNESVLYTEKIATSMMKEGTTYTLEVSLVNQPGYTLSQQLTPQCAASDHSFLKESEQSAIQPASESPFDFNEKK